MSEQSTPKTYRSIGTSPVRPDGIDKVTGRANYGADRHLPGMLHGKTLRSRMPMRAFARSMSARPKSCRASWRW